MKNSLIFKKITSVGVAMLCAYSLSPQAQAASDVSAEQDPGVEISRDATALTDLVDMRPVDRDFINTALVLTDARGRGSVAYCVAYDQSGDPVGRGFTRVPGNGVSLVFASDLSNGIDFFGTIQCKSRGGISGTAYIVGPEFSDTRVHNLHDRAGSVVTVPVVISR